MFSFGNKPKKIFLVYGTRPEVIKFFPLFELLKKDIRFEPILVCTGQHDSLLKELHNIFDMHPKYNMDLANSKPTLLEVISLIITNLTPIIQVESPDLIMVQGDTSSAFSAALCAFYNSVPLAHLEAGLRTTNSKIPYPEEMNRRLITQLADIHFAASISNQNNLLGLGVLTENIFVTGNTGVDAVLNLASRPIDMSSEELREIIESTARIVLVTTHRRESWGQAIRDIAKALQILSVEYPDIIFLYPLHPNPILREFVDPLIKDCDNIKLIPPLIYSDLIIAMKRSSLILTDSGGIQEEAPSFGVHVLVLRDETERLEGVTAGLATLVGTNTDKIVAIAKRHLNGKWKTLGNTGTSGENPYGDGHAAARILEILSKYLLN